MGFKKFSIALVLMVTALAACLFAQTQAPSDIAPASSTAPQSNAIKATDSQTVSVFGEAGAYNGNQILGGLGLAVDVGAGQQVFGMLADQTGPNVAQNAQILFGVKSNYPSFKVNGQRIVPFSIIAYGASIASLKTLTIKPPTSLSLSATTVTSIATGAGLAQQYAVGMQITFKDSTTVGIGASLDSSLSGWRGQPFLFIGHTFK